MDPHHVGSWPPHPHIRGMGINMITVDNMDAEAERGPTVHPVWAEQDLPLSEPDQQLISSVARPFRQKQNALIELDEFLTDIEDIRDQMRDSRYWVHSVFCFVDRPA